jgi:hypothetical protein
LILADNLFLLRYRHRDDVPVDGSNSLNWAKGSAAKPYGTEWNRDGASFRDPEAKDTLGNPDDGLKFGGEFAGAANSPTVDRVYRAQLVMGWIKRVLDRVNPYEAASVISATTPHRRPMPACSGGRPSSQMAVALNPDKNVIENVGLIELYQTILDRGINLSIGLSSPITTPGINNALLLAATRISDLYTLLANEALHRRARSTVGFVLHGLDLSAPSYSSMAGDLSFKPGFLAARRGALPVAWRGRTITPARSTTACSGTSPGKGEVAYAMNYNVRLEPDGFIDENDLRPLSSRSR